jgi:hypothetical protein
MEPAHAAGRLHFHRLARVLADQRARDWRGDRDLARLDVGLVFADDLVAHGRAIGFVLEVHRRAKHAAPVGVHEPGVDHLRVGELRLEVRDAPLDEALALARRLVLGVLRQVAVRARLGDRQRVRRALDAAQPLQLGAQILRAPQGHRGLWHGGMLRRWPLR